MTQTIAKRNPRSNGTKAKAKGKESKREQVRRELKDLGMMRLRKHAIGALNIPTDVVDGWTDYGYILDYCVAKQLGEPLPEDPAAKMNGEEEEYSGNGESSEEFDASDLLDETSKAGPADDDDDSWGDDDALEGPEDEGEEMESAPEPEPAPEPPKKQRRKTKTPVVEEPVSADSDLEVTLRQMLDVITNQGVAIAELRQSSARLESTVKEVYVRQEATHNVLGAVGKTTFAMSSIVSGLLPKFLRFMRYKPSELKAMRGQADAAGVNAQELFNSFLDPDAETEGD